MKHVVRRALCGTQHRPHTDELTEYARGSGNRSEIDCHGPKSGVHMCIEFRGSLHQRLLGAVTLLGTGLGRIPVGSRRYHPGADCSVHSVRAVPSP